MKNKMKPPLLVIMILVITVVVSYGLCYFVDTIWNGVFVEWFENIYLKYVTTEYDYSYEGVVAQKYALNWSILKPFLLNFFIIGTSAFAGIILIVSIVSSRHSQKKTITEASSLLRTYMLGNEDVAKVFPKKYAEVYAQLSDIKSTLIQNEHKLKEEAARRNDLVAYLAHDLKTPLTSIIGYLSLIDEAADMPVKQREKYVNITLDKAYRLEKMINEFFEIARYNLQQISITKETVDLYYMLVQLSDELSPLLSANGNTVILDSNEDLTIPGDPDRLARVFNNILKNATAYSFPNTEIRISAREKDDCVEISFINEGKTIPKEKLSAIFEKFYRIDEARTSNTGGAGLGLAIAKEIVTLHGGTLVADSKDNTVVFTITLPKTN